MNVKINAEMIPLFIPGINTKRIDWNFVAPKSLAASSNEKSNLSIAVKIGRIAKEAKEHPTKAKEINNFFISRIICNYKFYIAKIVLFLDNYIFFIKSFTIYEKIIYPNRCSISLCFNIHRIFFPSGV